MPQLTAAGAREALAHLHRIEAQSRGRGSQESRRAFRRFAVRGEAQLRSAERHAQHHASIEIHLRDISRQGVAFVTAERLPSRTFWTISFMHQGHVVVEKTIQVCHVQTIDDGCYLHGTRFVLSDGMLALLGVRPGDLDADAGAGWAHGMSDFEGLEAV